MKRCFVTGATGHLGIHLVKALLAEGHQVAILKRPESSFKGLEAVQDQLHVISGDLRDVQAFAADLEAFQPEVIFHLAWFGVGNAFRNDVRQIHDNLQGSLQLVDVGARAGCKVWIGLGSQAEYGRVNQKLTEDLPALPETTYGRVKHAVGNLTERLCEAYGMRFVWIRLVATFGPYDDPMHLLPFVMEQYLKGEVPSLTPGEQVWDYLYVDDAAQALVRLMESDATGIFNLASGEGRTVREMVETIHQKVGPHLESGLGRKPYAPDQLMYLQGDIQKLTAATGWTPTTSFEEGIERTLQWYAGQRP